ncbi:hypothetical protein RFI_08474 [Reticulomyxa filosa]|uniref:Uncharacterized protein n=1 Tax=Reticulomyxa filosa TaxID=46433 RepID=X6NRU0_RETFI|nr:hypothetical protein RFI_08474 [Reticulomyxa filosa]|eukprot:ETO28658.1 hypothetical protein RFI_08474 [Reticulomyxa filosa]
MTTTLPSSPFVETMSTRSTQRPNSTLLNEEMRFKHQTMLLQSGIVFEILKVIKLPHNAMLIPLGVRICRRIHAQVWKACQSKASMDSVYSTLTSTMMPFNDDVNKFSVITLELDPLLFKQIQIYQLLHRYDIFDSMMQTLLQLPFQFRPYRTPNSKHNNTTTPTATMATAMTTAMATTTTTTTTTTTMTMTMHPTTTATTVSVNALHNYFQVLWEYLKMIGILIDTTRFSKKLEMEKDESVHNVEATATGTVGEHKKSSTLEQLHNNVLHQIQLGNKWYASECATKHAKFLFWLLHKLTHWLHSITTSSNNRQQQRNNRKEKIMQLLMEVVQIIWKLSVYHKAAAHLVNEDGVFAIINASRYIQHSVASSKRVILMDYYLKIIANMLGRLFFFFYLHYTYICT